jgi:hypothetical protein
MRECVRECERVCERERAIAIPYGRGFDIWYPEKLTIATRLKI